MAKVNCRSCLGVKLWKLNYILQSSQYIVKTYILATLHHFIRNESDSYPITGCLKPSFLVASSISFSSQGCGRIKYLTNWDTHHTAGSPWTRTSRSARSSGTARGKYGGRGWRLSSIGSSTTWTFLSFISPKIISKHHHHLMVLLMQLPFNKDSGLSFTVTLEKCYNFHFTKVFTQVPKMLAQKWQSCSSHLGWCASQVHSLFYSTIICY